MSTRQRIFSRILGYSSGSLIYGSGRTSGKQKAEHSRALNITTLHRSGFLGGRYFLCRHCHNIAYSSQSEARYDRMLRRTNKLRVALGGEPGTAHFIAFKPKGMWQRTYQRKRFEIQWCEYQANQLFLSKFAYLLSAEERQLFFDE